MTLLHKKKNHYPPRWISITLIWSPTLFPRGIIIFQGVLTKFNFSMKFPHLEKFANLIKDLKYEHQSIFPLWGRVKLNFRDRYGTPNIFSENLSCCQVFSTNCHKMTLWHHWGTSQGVSNTPHDAPMTGSGDRCPHDGVVVTDAPCDRKTTLNIDIYPYTLAFFLLKILATSMILKGAGVVPGRVLGWQGVVHIQR